MLATANAGAAAPPTPAIISAILVPQDRIARQPLVPWAEGLLRRLQTVRKKVRGTRQLASGLGAIGNNAGLIAALRGETLVAWHLTERQIRWHGRQARRSRDAAVAAYAVQPWVNLGRLEALTGRWREALARFAGLSTYDVADRLEIGCVRIDGNGWSAVNQTREEFLGFLSAVYVTDSLKAMLLNRRFELVHRFAAHCRSSGDLRCVGEEACVVAACRMGDFAGAMARATAAAREAGGWNRAVLRLRAAETHACAGEMDRAAEILAHIAGVVRQVSAETMADPRLMPVTARVAGACHEVGRAEDACAVARRVLEGARAGRDETVEIEMLRLLAAVAPDEEREAWSDAARAAEETTEYARFRRGGPPPPNPVITELYERLEEVYSS